MMNAEKINFFEVKCPSSHNLKKDRQNNYRIYAHWLEELSKFFLAVYRV